MLPKISIITISYNSAKTIEKTIKSVIDQHYDNLEYIIIDGNSKDNTVEIIRKYEKNISRWVSEKDNGISDAFNKGISYATGDVIGILNSDDQYLPDALYKIAQNYSPEIDVYRGSILICNEITNEKYTYEPTMKFGIFPIGINVCHLPTFISKSAYEKYGGYDLEFKLAMDLDLLRRFYMKGAKFKKIDGVLGQFNVGGISTKAGNKQGYKEREKVILKNGGSKLHLLGYRGIVLVIGIAKKFIEGVLGINYKKIRYRKKIHHKN